jgi:hypothetical protein
VRVTSNNPWGVAGGLEVQRSDLWSIDLSEVVNGLANLDTFNQAGGLVLSDASRLLNIVEFFPCSVTLPDLVVTPMPTRRDSRPYYLPGDDEPPGNVRVVFIHDVATSAEGDIYNSQIYTLLSLWRSVTRAGRGAMSGEAEFVLDASFKAPPYRFDIPINLNSGENPNSIDDPTSTQLGLQLSARYVLKNAWLSMLHLGELSYEGEARAYKIDTHIMPEDILQG